MLLNYQNAFLSEASAPPAAVAHFYRGAHMVIRPILGPNQIDIYYNWTIFLEM